MMKPTPLQMLFGGVVLHQGYALAPATAQPMVWNALGATARLVLMLALVYPVTQAPMAAVVAWIAAEELQVVVCNLAFTASPWEVRPGQEMCSSLIGTDLGRGGVREDGDRDRADFRRAAVYLKADRRAYAVTARP